jgi:hypothetical protein
MTGSGRLAPAAYYFVEDSHGELMKSQIRELSLRVGKGIDNFVAAKMGAPWVIPVMCPMTRTLGRVINQDRTDRTAAYGFLHFSSRPTVNYEFNARHETLLAQGF